MSNGIPLLDLRAMHDEIRGDLDELWHQIVDNSGFVGGSPVEIFEEKWARYCGTEHAIGVGNGTDALLLALRALGIGRGDEVIVPANTFVATAAAVVLAGATPRFVDVDPGTLLISAEHIDAAVTPRTAAVMVVHLYGQMPNMDEVCAVARRHGISVIEDAAQAQGAEWRGRRAGSFGDIGCFSFYPGKNLGAFGDAGAVVTSDWQVAETIRSLNDHGRRSNSKYVHDLVGTNSRLDALQAGVLTAKLRRLDAWNEARRWAMAQYRERLSATDIRFVDVHPDAVSVHHLAAGQVEDREETTRRLDLLGVSYGVHYPVPCHKQLAFDEYALEPLPVVESAAERLLSLPLFPTITTEQIDRVCSAMTAPLAVLPQQRRPVHDVTETREELSNAG